MKLSKINPSTLIGAIAAVAMLAIVLAFAATDPGMYVNLPGLAIVLGGTLAATFIAYPLHEVLRVFSLLRTIFRGERSQMEHDVEELIRMSQLWMKNDVRKVEEELQQLTNPFLRVGVQLVIDNTPEDQIIDLLQWRISRLRAREHAEAQMFRVMAAFAPAFGMLGTLIGLINLLSLLSDGSMAVVGQQMAIALMTTFYGILLANLVLKPVAVKLERRTEQRLVLMNMIMQGIAMMCDKRSPSVMRETLRSFMTHYEDEMHDGGQTEAPQAGTATRAS